MNILWILLAHYICDYALQDDFLAETKGKYFYSLFVHSMICGLGMSLCLHLLNSFSLWKAIILVISHMIIDYKKSTVKNKDKALTIYLYIDQALHIGLSILLYLI